MDAESQRYNSKPEKIPTTSPTYFLHESFIYKNHMHFFILQLDDKQLLFAQLN